MEEIKQGEVKITTKEYNELRDFKSAIERNDLVKMYYSTYDHLEPTFITKDSAIKNLLNDIGNYKADIERQSRIIIELKNPLPKETTLQDVSKMNIFEFIKWKRKNK